MKKILFLLTLFTLIYTASLNAQDRFDAIRLSQNFYEGTARFTSMGGAFAALGGDFTTLSINPAGIGIYRSTEFSFTPAISYSSTESSVYSSANESDSRTKFGFSNMGFVMPAYISGSSKGLVNMNFAVGYNKLNNFNSNVSAVGRNIESGHSLLENIVYQANEIGYHVDEFTSSNPYNSIDMFTSDWPVILAWDRGLIIDTETNSYAPNVTYGNHSKYAQTESNGSIGEYVVSFGGNISHKFYFGFTLGIQDVSYESFRYYREDMLNPVDLNSLTFNQSYKTSGIGYNFKGGVIYRPIPELRLALATHTPTSFYLTDEYSASLSSNVSGSQSRNNTPRNHYDYRIESPYKLILGAAYTFKSYGLISLDYELVNYSSMRMKEDHGVYTDIDNPFHGENQVIKNTLRTASNFRVGLEGNLPEGFAIRAGYAFYGSPYKDNKKDEYIVEDETDDITVPTYTMAIGNYHTNTYSLGVGYRFKGGFVDFGFSSTRTNVKYLLDAYNDFGIMSPVKTKTNFNRFVLTLGIKL